MLILAQINKFVYFLACKYQRQRCRRQSVVTFSIEHKENKLSYLLTSPITRCNKKNRSWPCQLFAINNKRTVTILASTERLPDQILFIIFSLSVTVFILNRPI